MKLITALIDPACLADVRKRLEVVGIETFCLRQSFIVDRKHARHEIYRGSSYVVDRVSRLELSMVIDDDDVAAIVTIIERRGGEGHVVVSPIDEVVHMPARTMLEHEQLSRDSVTGRTVRRDHEHASRALRSSR